MARKTRKTAPQPAEREGVSYDRETGDFVIYAAGSLVGFAATSAEATERYNARLTANAERCAA